jgi:hypothetical protein
MTEKQRAKFENENIKNTKTAAVWRMRENFLSMYDSKTQKAAKAYFNRW